MRLLRKTSFVARRYKENGGEFDASFNWVKGSYTPISFKCSLQPINRGQDVRLLPEGISARDAYLVLTKTELLEDDEFLNQKADEIEIKGRTFKAHNVAGWIGNGLKSDHYRCIFIRNDKK
jgi:hypothetical protein